MRIATWMGIALLVGAGAWCLGGSTARAEDPVEAQRPPSLRYDLRVVRVSVPAKTVESAPTLPSTNELGVSGASWRELLAALQARGSTQVLMDRSATAVVATAANLSQTQIWNVMVTRRADLSNTSRETVPVKVGANADLIAQATPGVPTLQYAIDVDWLGAREAEGQKQERATWRGGLALDANGTLVLRHAQQDDDKAGTEIYVLLSWRR